MTDTKHLIKRHATWYFHTHVPIDLQDVIGKKQIVVTLKTRDLKEAQKLRHEYLAAYNQHFDRLRGKTSPDNKHLRSFYLEQLSHLNSEGARVYSDEGGKR